MTPYQVGSLPDSGLPRLKVEVGPDESVQFRRSRRAERCRIISTRNENPESIPSLAIPFGLALKRAPEKGPGWLLRCQMTPAFAST